MIDIWNATDTTPCPVCEHDIDSRLGTGCLAAFCYRGAISGWRIGLEGESPLSCDEEQRAALDHWFAVYGTTEEATSLPKEVA